MKRIISFMHVSLDGFVAGPNGEMDWITFDEELFDYIGTRISKTDTALYGRVTYELMQSYWPTAADKPNSTKHDREHAAWYSVSRKVVLSKTLEETGLPNTTLISDNLTESLTELKQPGHGASEEILLFGSPTATHALIQRNLIDGYWLFVNPIILGKGMPLFAGVTEKTKLSLLTTRPFSCGVTELNYRVDRY
jgi:dihydrofolate reductase